MELEKIYNNADNHEVAAYTVYTLDYSEDGDEFIYYDKELTKKVTPDDLVIAFIKGIVIIPVTDKTKGTLSAERWKPSSITKSTNTESDTGYIISIPVSDGEGSFREDQRYTDGCTILL